jgi:hypothetical protein
MLWNAIVTTLIVPLCGRKLRMSNCVTMIYFGLDDADVGVVIVGIRQVALIFLGD